jgi:hypothetical protein
LADEQNILTAHKLTGDAAKSQSVPMLNEAMHHNTAILIVLHGSPLCALLFSSAQFLDPQGRDELKKFYCIV